MNSPSQASNMLNKKPLHITIPPLDISNILAEADALERAKAEAPRAPVKPPKRCMAGECRVRLGLTAFACRCGGYYCGAHRFDEAHACSYDYKAEQQALLSSQMVKVVGKKVDII